MCITRIIKGKRNGRNNPQQEPDCNSSREFRNNNISTGNSSSYESLLKDLISNNFAEDQEDTHGQMQSIPQQQHQDEEEGEDDPFKFILGILPPTSFQHQEQLCDSLEPDPIASPDRIRIVEHWYPFSKSHHVMEPSSPAPSTRTTVSSSVLPPSVFSIRPTSIATPSSSGGPSSLQQKGEPATKPLRITPSQETKWLEYFEALKQFKIQNGGDCNVPTTQIPNKNLALWVKRIRHQCKLYEQGKHSSLTPQRIQLLESIDFQWQIHDGSWSDHYNDLCTFYQRNGHLRVPVKSSAGSTASSDSTTTTRLYNWIKRQRQQCRLFRQGKPSPMTYDRCSKLMAIGLVKRDCYSTPPSQQGSSVEEPRP